jgi:hypothetical protein
MSSIEHPLHNTNKKLHLIPNWIRGNHLYVLSNGKNQSDNHHLHTREDRLLGDMKVNWNTVGMHFLTHNICDGNNKGSKNNREWCSDLSSTIVAIKVQECAPSLQVDLIGTGMTFDVQREGRSTV